MPFEPEPEVSAGSSEHTNAFWDNLTANAITCDYCYCESFQTDSPVASMLLLASLLSLSQLPVALQQ